MRHLCTGAISDPRVCQYHRGWPTLLSLGQCTPSGTSHTWTDGRRWASRSHSCGARPRALQHSRATQVFIQLAATAQRRRPLPSRPDLPSEAQVRRLKTGLGLRTSCLVTRTGARQRFRPYDSDHSESTISWPPWTPQAAGVSKKSRAAGPCCARTPQGLDMEENSSAACPNGRPELTFCACDEDYKKKAVSRQVTERFFAFQKAK